MSYLRCACGVRVFFFVLTIVSFRLLNDTIAGSRRPHLFVSTRLVIDSIEHSATRVLFPIAAPFLLSAHPNTVSTLD